jgi:site-specific DNA-adenine methylase
MKKKPFNFEPVSKLLNRIECEFIYCDYRLAPESDLTYYDPPYNSKRTQSAYKLADIDFDYSEYVEHVKQRKGIVICSNDSLSFPEFEQIEIERQNARLNSEKTYKEYIMVRS